MADAGLVDRMVNATAKGSLAGAADQDLDHAGVGAEAVDLLDRLDRVLRGDQDRALVAIEWADPGFQGPVVDTAGKPRGNVDVGLDTETGQGPSEDGNVDPTGIEVALLRHGWIAGRRDSIRVRDSEQFVGVAGHGWAAGAGDAVAQAIGNEWGDGPPIGDPVVQIGVDGAQADRIAADRSADRWCGHPLLGARRRGPKTSSAFSTKMRCLRSLRAAGMKVNAARGLSKSQWG